MLWMHVDLAAHPTVFILGQVNEAESSFTENFHDVDCLVSQPIPSCNLVWTDSQVRPLILTLADC